jgi:hypothetical protein
LEDFFFDDPSSVKFDEAWLKNFMEPTTLQTPTNENINLMAAFNVSSTKNSSDDFIEQQELQYNSNSQESLISINESAISSGGNNENLSC